MTDITELDNRRAKVLADLIARVERATGEDSELDWAIAELLCPEEAALCRVDRPEDTAHIWWGLRFTSRVDAVLGLIERKLPTAIWFVWSLEDKLIDAEIKLNGAKHYGLGRTTPSLALLLAALRAIQQGE